MDLRSHYDTTDGVIREVSNLEEGYFAFYGGAHTNGFEIDAKIGGTFQELREKSLSSDPFEDGGGLIVGTSARWGYSPAYGFRFGLGGQFTYSYSEGRAYVSDDVGRIFRETLDLEFLRGQLFTGISFDLRPRRDVALSPYVGVGAEFIDGSLSIQTWDPWYVYRREVGDLDEKRIPFGFAGLDLHFSRRFRIGIEGKGNDVGWQAAATVGVTF